MEGNQNLPLHDMDGRLIVDAPANRDPVDATAGQNTAAGAAAAASAPGGSQKSGAQALSEMTATVMTLLAEPVTSENAVARNAEIAKCREQLAKIQDDINAENARMVERQAYILNETKRLEEAAVHLSFCQIETEVIHRRRHQSRLPAAIEPTQLFNTLRDLPALFNSGTNMGSISELKHVPVLIFRGRTIFSQAAI